MRKVRGNDVAMIFQEPMTSLNPVLTIGFQIAEALILHRGLSRKAAAEAETVRLLEKVRIPAAKSRFDEYPHRFSGGMRQRVMIAMALACKPEAADRRRADHRARRDDPGADPRADQDAAGGGGHVRPLHHPRHGRGRRNRRPHGGDVSRRGGRDRRDRRTSSQSRQHPYTRALLSAVPKLGSMEGKAAAALSRRRPQPARCRRPVETPIPSKGRSGPVLEVRNLTTRFDIRSGLLRPQGHQGRVHAVENVSFDLRRARRWRWSANPAAASRPPAARSCG
jgi:peptide/nickel transport system ATP-binding protein